MLCTYKYRTTQAGTQGWFQCDTEDFKQFWKANTDLMWCHVKLQDGRNFYYHCKWRERKLRDITSKIKK